MTERTDPEREILQAALQGDVAAATELARALADLVWTACLRVTRGGADAEAAFREVMAALRANGFARLRGFDGRARVRVYAALVVRDLLSERVIKLLALNVDAGWRSFEVFFPRTFDASFSATCRDRTASRTAWTLTRPCAKHC